MPGTPRRHARRLRPAAALALALGAGLVIGAAPATDATAQRGGLDREQYMGGIEMLRAFTPVVGEHYRAVVKVRANNRNVALGTIIAADGLILSKASELDGEIECELADGRRLIAEVLASDEITDLALLRIDATDLMPIQWIASDEATRVGQWAISAYTDPEPLAVGVISVPNREIAGTRLILGFLPNETDEGVVVRGLSEDMGAQEAGMEEGDIILSVNGMDTPNVRAISDALEEGVAGQIVPVVIQRDDETITLDVELSAAKAPDTRNMQGRVSDRDYGFEEVIQHDTVLTPRDCGGPLLDIRGMAVGINIARAGRVASYALPISQVEPALERLLDKAGLQADAPEQAPEPDAEPEEAPQRQQAVAPESADNA